MKRLIALLTILFISAGLFAGCGSKKEEQPQTSQSIQAQSSQTENVQATKEKSSAAVFPLTVKDAKGTDVTIEKEPVNIISLTLGTDEMLLSMVDASRIKALTKYADDPAISNVPEDAKKVPARATWDDIEGIIALQPDLVLADTWADEKAVKQLRDAGLTVYVFKTPGNIELQKSTVLEIAHVVGADSKGAEITAWMDEKLNAVNDKLKSLKPENKLSVMDYGEMGSSGKGTNFDDIVTRAGLTNVVAKAGIEGWQQISKEKIVELNPDIMILPSWFYDKKNTLQGMKDTLKNDKSLADVGAIKNDRLISLPNPHISAISQFVVLGVEDAAKAAYPELFK